MTENGKILRRNPRFRPKIKGKSLPDVVDRFSINKSVGSDSRRRSVSSSAPVGVPNRTAAGPGLPGSQLNRAYKQADLTPLEFLASLTECRASRRGHVGQKSRGSDRSLVLGLPMQSGTWPVRFIPFGNGYLLSCICRTKINYVAIIFFVFFPDRRGKHGVSRALSGVFEKWKLDIRFHYNK